MKVPIEWLKTYVPIRLKPDSLAHKLTMGGIEVEAVECAGSETIFELGVTPNRGDCLSIIGVAREVAAITNKEFETPVWKAPRGKGRIAGFARVSVKHSSRLSAILCSCYRWSSHWVVTGLDCKEACGFRCEIDQ